LIKGSGLDVFCKRRYTYPRRLVVDVKILESATKNHKVSEETIKYCLEHRIDRTLINAVPEEHMYACWDQNGNFMELGIRETDDTCVVFHAMKIRQKYRFLIG
jgi:hypothetical protein